MTMLRIKKVKVVNDFVLDMQLSNGMRIERDLTEYVHAAGGVLAPLRDPVFFRKAKVSYGAIGWPGEIDLDPDVLIWGGMPPSFGQPLKFARLSKTRTKNALKPLRAAPRQ